MICPPPSILPNNRAPLHFQRTPRQPPRAGFTLIELLVVISIIGVVVGLTLPALSGARQQAVRLKCMTNLKGFGVAFQLYINDHKRLPYVLPFYDINIPNNPQTDPQLLDVLEAYMDVPPPRKDPVTNIIPVYEPYLCPADKDDDGARATGLSYQYWAGGLMLLRELFRAESPDMAAATVTIFFENPGSDSTAPREFPVMADAKPWHPGGREYNQNALYFGDWHTDWLHLNPQSTLDRQHPVIPPP